MVGRTVTFGGPGGPRIAVLPQGVRQEFGTNDAPHALPYSTHSYPKGGKGESRGTANPMAVLLLRRNSETTVTPWYWTSGFDALTLQPQRAVWGASGPPAIWEGLGPPASRSPYRALLLREDLRGAAAVQFRGLLGHTHEPRRLRRVVTEAALIHEYYRKVA